MLVVSVLLVVVVVVVVRAIVVVDQQVFIDVCCMIFGKGICMTVLKVHHHLFVCIPMMVVVKVLSLTQLCLVSSWLCI